MDSAVALFGGAVVLAGVIFYSCKGAENNKPITLKKPADLQRKVVNFTTQYTIEEIAKHNTAEDLWIIVGTKVYDITTFANDHPGELAPLLARAGFGQDATKGFFGGQHPDSVEDQIRQYHIGVLKEYPIDEIARHNTPSDCWLIIENKVYDVSAFVAAHPGGEAILRNAGADSTQGFKKVAKHKPTDTSQNYSTADLEMAKYLIGAVQPAKAKAD